MLERADPDWSQIQSLYLCGEYGACRQMLIARPEPAAQIWLARLESRCMREEDSLERLLSIKTHDQRLAAERDVWIAAAYTKSGDFRMTHRLLKRALQVLQAPEPAFFRAMHVRALALFSESRYDESWTAGSALLESSDPNDRAQGHSLHSWVYAKRDHDLRAQLRASCASLECYEQTHVPDQFTFVRTLYTLSVLCREAAAHDAIEAVRRNAARVRFNEATSSPFFQMTRMLGWVDALQGDELSAMRRWREAEAIAPSEFWRIFCLVDRAYLANAMGREKSARELLLQADRHASELSWSATQDEERLILLTIAQLLAPDEPARAERYLAMFRSLNTQVDQRMMFHNDRRTRALQLYPQGTALLELGERDIAIPMLEEAWSIFSHYEYGWRAALAAIKLFEATGDPAWRVRARENIAPWPKSWIARNV